jgi:hypothetical protein
MDANLFAVGGREQRHSRSADNILANAEALLGVLAATTTEDALKRPPLLRRRERRFQARRASKNAFGPANDFLACFDAGNTGWNWQLGLALSADK